MFRDHSMDAPSRPARSDALPARTSGTDVLPPPITFGIASAPRRDS